MSRWKKTVADTTALRSVWRDLAVAVLAGIATYGVVQLVDPEADAMKEALIVAGTPVALKQAVHEAGNTVESAMKVVLAKRKVPYDSQRDTAYPLFEHLVQADVVPRHMQNLVLAAASPRNKKGGHGAGAVHRAFRIRRCACRGCCRGTRNREGAGWRPSH
ncbi:MAG: hypothetical protein ACR2G3_03865 [Solirubrobacterales bacterium]